ncbi:MAG: hypothetical protein IT338_18395 [Thermomicrobiales bacterium]|nr:hypothetical protein [Thermomicrobiales bacterium]
MARQGQTLACRGEIAAVLKESSMVTHARRCLPIAIVLALLTALTTGPAAAQTDAMPGVRGPLYESPTYGWILIATEPDWRFAGTSSADGVDTVHLVSSAGDGADDYYVSYLDDGRGAEGCAHDLVDLLAQTYDAAPLQGWSDSAVEYIQQEPDRYSARARAPNPNDPGLDILAYIDCRAGKEGVLIGDALLRTARDLDNMVDLTLLSPMLPGEGHTGRPRPSAATPTAGVSGDGVVRFLARGFPPLSGGEAPFPFSCIDQDSFTRPAEAPPPDRGWYACDGEIANVDVVPATIDLSRIVLGCADVPPGDLPPGCADDLTPPSHYELLSGPEGVAGPVVTLQPGDVVEVVLWYALPGGDPPADILYQEPDRLVHVGPTFFSAGSGARIPVRVGR